MAAAVTACPKDSHLSLGGGKSQKFLGLLGRFPCSGFVPSLLLQRSSLLRNDFGCALEQRLAAAALGDLWMWVRGWQSKVGREEFAEGPPSAG